MPTLAELLAKQRATQAQTTTPKTLDLGLNRKEAASIRSEAAKTAKTFTAPTPKVSAGDLAALVRATTRAASPLPTVPRVETDVAPVQATPLALPTPPTLVQSAELTYDADQAAAVDGMLREKYCCLIGAAGTGKTTTLKTFLARLLPTLQMQKVTHTDRETGETHTSYRLPIVFCAFTGRAVEQMKRALPPEWHANCGTIHGEKVLAYQPTYEDVIEDDGTMRTKMVFRPYHTASNKMPYLYYIMDEAGMTGVELWNTFFDAVLPEARVVLVGDINQLPPVYGRSVLGYAMTKWPTFELRTIHRQAADNPIIANAHRILNGALPQRVEKQFDILDTGDRGSSGVQQYLISAVRKLWDKGEFDRCTDGIIVPQNVGPLGQVQLNEYFNPMFNPGAQTQIIKTGIAIVHFAVGDKVMMTSNDKTNQLTNGQVGFIRAISINGNYKNEKAGAAFNQQALTVASTTTLTGDDLGDDFSLTMEELAQEGGFAPAEEEDINQRQASHIVEVDFSGRLVPFATAGEFRRLAPAYAITCHKSQGGEYPVVFILAHSANARMLSREWLYTAVTRARTRVVLVCNMRGLQQALKVQRIQGQTLAEKVASYIKFAEEAENGSGELPNLPTPHTLENV